MATPNAINVQLWWTLNGTSWAVNSLWYNTGAATPIDQAVTNAIAASVNAAITAATPGNAYVPATDLAEIRVRDHRTDGNPVFIAPLVFTGLGGPNMSPRQTCVVTTIQSVLFSRRGRGRIYWPAPAEGVLTNVGTLTAGGQTIFQNFTEELLLLDAGTLGNIVLSVFSRSDNVVRTVVSHTTDTTFDVQTRRRDVAV